VALKLQVIKCEKKGTFFFWRGGKSISKKEKFRTGRPGGGKHRRDAAKISFGGGGEFSVQTPTTLEKGLFSGRGWD